MSSTPEYRLEYFNLRGRAEPIRWILAVVEQPYQDIRFDKEAEWPKKKSDTPYGKLPVLYADGRPLSQSVAICRYLGVCHGFASSDPWMAAVGDEVVDAVHDLLPQAAQIVYAKLANDPEKAKRLAAEFYTSTLPPVLRELEKRLAQTPYFCGDEMTWVDVFTSCYLSQLSSQHKDCLDSAPKIRDLLSKVTSKPALKKWLEERPVTPM
ncbi:Glutathione S-transferase C-terminal [Trinorchestia longiramus]|nr:Glutathione S-transferase C-terminal [Trinorchestia longiramus]